MFNNSKTECELLETLDLLSRQACKQTELLMELNLRAATNRQERIARERKQPQDDERLDLYRNNVRRERIKKLLTDLNRELVGYPSYTKLSAPAISALREMGLTTSAVKVVASVNDEQISF